MLVVDASVLANVVGDDRSAGRRARDQVVGHGDLAAPDLVDVETLAVLRRRWLAGTLDDPRFDEAVTDLVALPLTRFPVRALLSRAAELRANVTAYDACYVALAEALDCALLTADVRLTRAPGLRCPVRVLRLPQARGRQ